MHRLTARILGVIVLLLGVVGLFVTDEHLLGIMNVDLPLDIIRIILGAALLYVDFGPASHAAAKTLIIIVGAMYVLLGLLAFADDTLFGLLPTGFTGFDIGFHLVVGVAALVIAFMPVRDHDRHETVSRRH